MRAVDAGGVMVERCGMKLVASIVVMLLFALLGSAPSVAQSASERVTASNAFAQSEPRRARTRLRVRPLYPYRRYHSLYPPPYDIEYRPSGTVIVPRMRCRWVRG
jgi:hypothetical protein